MLAASACCVVSRRKSAAPSSVHWRTTSLSLSLLRRVTATVTRRGASEAAGADYVKTSTGFHPAGGATVHAVELMSQTVGERLGVKASGGIRDWETAQAMVAAGATRLGLSGTRAVLEGGSSEGY